jgi:conjugative transfer signal peptidase TraF
MLLNARRWRVALTLQLAAAAIAAVVAGGVHPPRLIWNATASAPIGLYLVRRAQTLFRGELVLARLPAVTARLAARRGYLPLGLPVVKRIVGLSGDQICAHGNKLWRNGHFLANRLAADSRQRPLPDWQGCRRLSRAEVFLLMAHKRYSFDSRYFGPVRRAAIIGRLVPLWLR